MRKGVQEKLTFISIRMSVELRKRIQKEGEAEDRPLGNMARVLIAEALNARQAKREVDQ